MYCRFFNDFWSFSKPFRADWNSSGSEIMLYFREYLTSNFLKIEPSLIEGDSVELKLQIEKWLIELFKLFS